MDIRWYKLQKNIKKRRYSLRPLGVGIIFFAFLYLLTEIFNASLCPIYNIFGIKCFGCGMTRGLIAILKLNFAEALKYNVLSVPVFFCVGIYCLISVADVIFDSNITERIEKILGKWYMLPVYVGLLGVNAWFNGLF